MFVEVIAAAVTTGRSAEQTEANAVALSLRSAAGACRGVQRVATGWSVNRVCGTATGQADPSKMDDDGIGGSTRSAAQPAWLDVPVVTAGLLIWARTHQEIVLQRYVYAHFEKAPLG